MPSKTLHEQLKINLNAIGKEEHTFAFSVGKNGPRMAVQKLRLTPAKFAKMAKDASEDINTSKIWVGTIKKVEGEYRLIVDEGASKGKVSIPLLRKSLKALSRAAEIPKLRSAEIVDALAEMSLAEDTVALDEGLSEGNEDLRSEIRRIRTLEDGQISNKIRTETMKALRQNVGKHLYRTALSDDSPGDSEELMKMWAVQKMAMASSGVDARGKELILAAKMAEAERVNLQRALEAALALDPADPAAVAQAADNLEELADWIEATIDIDPIPSEAEQSVVQLGRTLKAARAALAEASEPIGDAHAAADEVLEAEFHEKARQKWVKQSRDGRLQVPDDTEVIEVTDPGVKRKLRVETTLYNKFNLTDPVKTYPKGTPVVARVLTPEIAWVEAYVKKADFGLRATDVGYAAASCIGDHRKKRSHVAVGGHLFDGPPQVSDIKQGAIGDCYLVAALGAMAQQDPATVADLIVDNGDGTCTVKLHHVQMRPEDPENEHSRKVKYFEPVYIQIDKTVTHTDYSMVNGRAGGALWVQMLEKAYAAYGAQLVGSNRNFQLGYQGIEGGHAYNPFEVFMGRTSEHVEPDREPEESAEWMGAEWPFPASGEPLDGLSMEESILALCLMSSNEDFQVPSCPAIRDIASMDAEDAEEALLTQSNLTGKQTIQPGALVRKRLLEYQSTHQGRISRIEREITKRKRKGRPVAQNLLRQVEESQGIIATVNEKLEEFAAMEDSLQESVEIDLDTLRQKLIDNAVNAGKMPGVAGSGKYAEHQLAMAERIRDALAAGRCVAASTPEGEQIANVNVSGATGVLSGLVSRALGSGESVKGGIVATHAYTLTGIDFPEEGEQGVIWVHLRNPWGKFSRKTTRTDDGELVHKVDLLNGDCRLELTNFLKTYREIQFC